MLKENYTDSSENWCNNFNGPLTEQIFVPNIQPFKESCNGLLQWTEEHLVCKGPQAEIKAGTCL